MLLTRCDRRRSSVQQVRDDLIAALGDKVFDAMIPYLTEAAMHPVSDAAASESRAVRSDGPTWPWQRRCVR